MGVGGETVRNLGDGVPLLPSDFSLYLFAKDCLDLNDGDLVRKRCLEPCKKGLSEEQEASLFLLNECLILSFDEYSLCLDHLDLGDLDLDRHELLKESLE